jgi:DHA1 family tetracycline resistance protein-like MFS transporter
MEPDETLALEAANVTGRPGGLVGGKRKAALVFIFVTIVIDMISFGVLIPVLSPLILNLAGGHIADATKIGGIFGTIFAMMQIIFSPLLGILSDRFGRRPVILISTFGLAIDGVIMALAPSLAWLFVGRIIAGITAANMVTAGAYIADVTPLEKRAAGFGIIGAAFGIGFIAGPALGGFAATFGLRAPFWLAAGLCFANFVYGLFVLPESLPPEKRTKTVAWGRANPLGSLKLLRSHPELFGLAAVNLIAYIAHQSFGVYVFYTILRFGWSPQTNGLSLALVGVVSVLVSMVLVKQAVARFGERTTLLLGLGCAAVGFTLWAFAPNAAVFVVGIVFVSLWGLMTPASQSLMSRRVQPQEQGELQGAINALRSLATLIGPVLFAWVFAAFIAPGRQLPGAPWLLAALLLLLSLAVALPVTRRTWR